MYYQVFSTKADQERGSIHKKKNLFPETHILGPILANQTTKFELSGQFRFSRHPCGPWGRQNSGMEPKSATYFCQCGCHFRTEESNPSLHNLKCQTLPLYTKALTNIQYNFDSKYKKIIFTS